MLKTVFLDNNLKHNFCMDQLKNVIFFQSATYSNEDP